MRSDCKSLNTIESQNSRNTYSKCLGSGGQEHRQATNFHLQRMSFTTSSRQMKRPVLGDDVSQEHECLVREEVSLSLPTSFCRKRETWSNDNDNSDRIGQYTCDFLNVKITFESPNISVRTSSAVVQTPFHRLSMFDNRYVTPSNHRWRKQKHDFTMASPQIRHIALHVRSTQQDRKERMRARQEKGRQTPLASRNTDYQTRACSWTRREDRHIYLPKTSPHNH